jgi:hypothetical protein
MDSSPVEYAGLEQWMWARLPPSKFLAGRRRVLGLIPLAIDRWSDAITGVTDEGDPRLTTIAESLRQDIHRIYADRRYGSLWIILLSSLVGELVRLLVLWWLSSSDHQDLFRQWRRSRDG